MQSNEQHNKKTIKDNSMSGPAIPGYLYHLFFHMANHEINCLFFCPVLTICTSFELLIIPSNNSVIWQKRFFFFAQFLVLYSIFIVLSFFSHYFLQIPLHRRLFLLCHSFPTLLFYLTLNAQLEIPMYQMFKTRQSKPTRTRM